MRISLHLQPRKKKWNKNRVGERNKRVGVGVMGGVGLVFLALPPHPGVQLLFASDASAGLVVRCTPGCHFKIEKKLGLG